ncbi:MAG: lipid-A-disaccharide synthase [Candidatus Cloacimonadota bacterium]|nr:MAG: lipid-A-disaccharide synthase [Candidatus Cloacimonadota bacterium]
MKNIFISVGESSGDIHAARIIFALQKKNTNLQFYGIGGKEMTKLGFNTLFPIQKFSVMGFVEVVKHLPFFKTVIKKIKLEFQERKPSLVILIDYPGLNFQIAKIAHKLNIPILYYITPQVWAWNKRRVYKIKKLVTKSAVIFPFEKELFQDIGIDVEFVGHPIVEEIEFKLSKEEFISKYNLRNDKKWLAFLPGSRNIEIKKILPQFVNTISVLSKRDKYQFLLSISDTVDKNIFLKIIDSIRGKISLVTDVYEMIKYSDVVISKSGTSTLQTGFIGTPLIIVYKTSFISYLIGRYFVKIKYIGLPNIMLGKSIVPELIQNNANPEQIIKEIDKIENDKIYREQMITELSRIRNLLGNKTASENVAHICLELINETNRSEDIK